VTLATADVRMLSLGARLMDYFGNGGGNRSVRFLCTPGGPSNNLLCRLNFALNNKHHWPGAEALLPAELPLRQGLPLIAESRRRSDWSRHGYFVYRELRKSQGEGVASNGWSDRFVFESVHVEALSQAHAS